MAEFIIGKEVSTEKPTVEVTITKASSLAVGKHRFQLVVVDDSGNPSKADEVVVIVADKDAPTAVLKAPSIVGVGQSFTLDGSGSFDVGGGTVTQWVWTYVGPA